MRCCRVRGSAGAFALVAPCLRIRLLCKRGLRVESCQGSRSRRQGGSAPDPQDRGRESGRPPREGLGCQYDGVWRLIRQPRPVWRRQAARIRCLQARPERGALAASSTAGSWSRPATSCATVRAFRATPASIQFLPRSGQCEGWTVSSYGTWTRRSVSSIAPGRIAMAASDPLAAAEIWFQNPAKSPASGDLGRGHDGLGSICSAAHAGRLLDARTPSMFAIPHCGPDGVLWPDGAQEHLVACAGPNTQARAPPLLSQIR